MELASYRYYTMNYRMITQKTKKLYIIDVYTETSDVKKILWYNLVQRPPIRKVR